MLASAIMIFELDKLVPISPTDGGILGSDMDDKIRKPSLATTDLGLDHDTVNWARPSPIRRSA